MKLYWSNFSDMNSNSHQISFVKYNHKLLVTIPPVYKASSIGCLLIETQAWQTPPANTAKSWKTIAFQWEISKIQAKPDLLFFFFGCWLVLTEGSVGRSGAAAVGDKERWVLVFFPLIFFSLLLLLLPSLFFSFLFFSFSFFFSGSHFLFSVFVLLIFLFWYFFSNLKHKKKDGRRRW